MCIFNIDQFKLAFNAHCEARGEVKNHASKTTLPLTTAIPPLHSSNSSGSDGSPHCCSAPNSFKKYCSSAPPNEMKQNKSKKKKKRGLNAHAYLTIYIYIYIYIYMHTCVYVCMLTHPLPLTIFLCLYFSMYVCICMYSHPSEGSGVL